MDDGLTMTGFLARRLVNYVLLCLAATFLAFALVSVIEAPGDIVHRSRAIEG